MLIHGQELLYSDEEMLLTVTLLWDMLTTLA